LCAFQGFSGGECSFSVYSSANALAFLIHERNRHSWEMFENEHRRDGVRCIYLSSSEMSKDDLAAAKDYCGRSGIRVRGANGYACFDRMHVNRAYTCIESEQDWTHLREGMEAALEFVRGLGSERERYVYAWPANTEIPLLEKKDGAFVWDTLQVPEPEPVSLPSPKVSDELLVARVKRKKSLKKTWSGCLLMSPKSMIWEGECLIPRADTLPFFPYAVALHEEGGGVLKVAFVPDPVLYAEDLCIGMLEMIEENGKPAKIYVPDERTYTFLSAVLRQVGIPLELREKDQELFGAVRSFCLDKGGEDFAYYDDFCLNDDLWEDDDEDDFEFDDDSYIDTLEDMILKNEILTQMPDDVLKSLMHSIVEKPLSQPATLLIIEEWKKRYLK